MADVQLVRAFRATPERLFQVVTREADILNWFGYDGVRFPKHNMDLTRLGPWSLNMIGADGTRFKLSGQVTKVDAPRSVSFTWGWHDEEDQRGAESHVTFRVEDLGDGRAQLTIDHVDLPSDEAAVRHTQGWTQGALPRLERYMATLHDATNSHQRGEKTMTKFLLAYHGGGMPETPEEGANEMTKWQSWLGGMGGSCADMGNPVGMSKTVSAEGVADNGGANPISGYSIVEADSIEAACEIAKGCPILDGAKGTVEVAPIVEM